MEGGMDGVVGVGMYGEEVPLASTLAAYPPVYMNLTNKPNETWSTSSRRSDKPCFMRSSSPFVSSEISESMALSLRFLFPPAAVLEWCTSFMISVRR
jgi:hypothetical protein